MTKVYDIISDPAGRRLHKSLWLHLLLGVLLVCGPGLSAEGKELPDARVSLLRKEKIAYGTFVAYEHLRYIFPNSTIKVHTGTWPEITNSYEGKKALIFIGYYADPNEAGVNAMMTFIGQGNHIFLSALQYGDTLLNMLQLKIAEDSDKIDMQGLRVSVLQPGTDDSLSFAYPGTARDHYVTSMDTQYATILGRDEKGRPNMVSFRYKGGGSLIINFAPLAFTNYFLLYKENIGYYNNTLSYIPNDVSEVLWDEHFRYGESGGGGYRDGPNPFSAWQYIAKMPSLKWAMILLLLLMLMVYLFESKRRQRMVPLIEGLRNNSLDFVQTIGRLYYQRRDNQNLVAKMATHFQDHVRTRYNISLHIADDKFVDHLSWKTGMSKEFLNVLTGELGRLQQSHSIPDEELLALNKKLEEFYKQA